MKSEIIILFEQGKTKSEIKRITGYSTQLLRYYQKKYNEGKQKIEEFLKNNNQNEIKSDNVV